MIFFLPSPASISAQQDSTSAMSNLMSGLGTALRLSAIYSYFEIETGLSKKVYATIPKGIVGGFEFTVLQRNLKEWHEGPWTYVCEC